ncbi:MAG TPA: cell wall hydrolase [Sphingomicrobium sp.]|nr:cell wall hydrolase [Sphingomicrobium sp.]
MVVSLRSALLVCAAMSASSVAPAQVGATAEPLLPLASSVSPSVIAEELLRNSQEVTAPVAEQETAIEEAAETVDPNADLATLVAQLRSPDPGDRQLECLAAGIYFESKSEPLAGQLAVGHVIANRANSGGRFPGSYCGVLFQRGQFSFVRGKSWPHIPKAGKQWKTAVAIAKIVHRDLKESSVGKALFFHAKRVRPGWRLKRVASIGNHIFYR